MIDIPRKESYKYEDVVELVNKAYIRGSDEVCASFNPTTKEEYIERVINATATILELTIEQIKSNSKSRDIIDSKKIIYHNLYPKVGTFKYIGKHFNQNHATVIFHYQTYDYLYINNSEFRRKAQRVQNLLKDE